MFYERFIESPDFLTGLNIVHSDLKPDNILVDTEKYEGIKIIDFGLAYNFYANGCINTATPEYMPPEALEIIFLIWLGFRSPGVLIFGWPG